ncbi:MAG: amidohydrolase [Alphaproteobacteria bacterium]|nr:amidohydrolase [Alphaproteobacteria bacterium]
MPLDPAVTALSSDMIQWRRHLHANPELSGLETATAAFIAEKLRAWGLEVTEGIGGHGVVGTLRHGQQHSGAPGRAIGLRADMDALPITEASNLPHRSTRAGVMHGCGHDGHVTMLLGAAAVLARNGGFSGTVHFIFQPAEERGTGARAMIADGLLTRFPVGRIFGLHNWPGLPIGQIAIHDRAVMAVTAVWTMTVVGAASHAAMPHLARDPIVAASQLVMALQAIASRNVDPLDAAVVSTTMISGGEAQNQIPHQVVVKGVVRCLRTEVRDLIAARMRAVAKGVADACALEISLEFDPRNNGTFNSPEARDEAASAAASVVGVGNVRRDLPPSMAGEDFAWYLSQVPGAFLWVGNGPDEGGRILHNPAYDFRDEAAPVGASFFVRLVRDLMPE